jgi:hypothetical protein
MHPIYSSGGILAIAVVLIPVGAQAIQPGAVPPASDVQLRPHVAVYDVTLHSVAPGSNVSDVRGRMVYSFRGSPCAGFTIVNRFVTQIFDRDGKARTTDMRSITWEATQAGQFRFNSEQYLNRQLTEQAGGLAARGPDGTDVLEVTIEKPRKHKVKIAGQPLFPTQHSLAILEAARAGLSSIQTKVYDGSESGNKVADTSTAIGKALPADANEALPRVKNAEQLDGMTSWPVSISYFEANKPPRSDDGLPSYELSFRLYANGVSRKLLINYGNFSVQGELSRIEFFEPAKCTGQSEPRQLAPVTIEDKKKLRAHK